MTQRRNPLLPTGRSCLLAALLLAASWAVQAQTSVTFMDTVKSGNGVGDINLRTPKSQATPPDLNAYITSVARGEFASAVNAISFGVDINEAANGTEKAETQAVTVEYAWLTVTDAVGTRHFGKAPTGTTTVGGSGFFTETQTLVAKKGSTQRATYPTLLGRSGSAQITGANSVTNTFDSTLKVVVPAGTSFSGVTAAVLHIRLLDTNGNLGDPEAFYDISGGYEDVALLNAADAQFLDATSAILAPRTLAPSIELSPQGKASALHFNTDNDPNTNVPSNGFNALFWISRPGTNRYNLVAYEDLYPKQGDYDFNDLVVAYNYALGVNGQGKVEEISGAAYMLSRGSSYTHDWNLYLPITLGSNDLVDPSGSYCKVHRSASQKVPGEVPSSGCSVKTDRNGITWKAFADTVSLFPRTDAGAQSAAVPINTVLDSQDPLRKGPKATMRIKLTSPILLKGLGKDDPYIRIYKGAYSSDNSGTAVHLYTMSAEAPNFPFAMMMPTQWKWPREKMDIGSAYPDFFKFVQSKGTQSTTWYNNSVSGKVSSTPNVESQPDWTVTNWSW